MLEEERKEGQPADPGLPPEGEAFVPEPAPEPVGELQPLEVVEEPPVVGTPDLEMPTAPAAAAPEASDDDRLMAALAWVAMVILQLPVVSLVLLIAEGNKNRLFQRYHAVTSILFWGAAFIYEILAGIVYAILGTVTLGCGFACLWVIFFLPHVAALYYALQAYNGKRVEIPAISGFARQQGWA